MSHLFKLLKEFVLLTLGNLHTKRDYTHDVNEWRLARPCERHHLRAAVAHDLNDAAMYVSSWQSLGAWWTALKYQINIQIAAGGHLKNISIEICVFSVTLQLNQSCVHSLGCTCQKVSRTEYRTVTYQRLNLVCLCMTLMKVKSFHWWKGDHYDNTQFCHCLRHASHHLFSLWYMEWLLIMNR